MVSLRAFYLFLAVMALLAVAVFFSLYRVNPSAAIRTSSGVSGQRRSACFKTFFLIFAPLWQNLANKN